ncbi:MAG: hypothetical protein COV47_02545 [Candidatus Diapherotrites archaeon CG11_big_fil_rev_8_21_14_0_20_37_9]|nr:MAG: hypothetical protein COV47_02545 [Candidatus Diapherotrites archaeon CG11_big_fil_rev_8_21_14_0_20_37_9]
MEKIGIGLIGCGEISARHFNAIKELNDLELKAVSDSDPAAAEKAGKENNVPYYTDNKKLFERKDISLVAICTPISTHTDISIEVLNSGKDVLTEKPVGITLESIDKLIAVGKKTGKKIFVVHQVRYNPSVYALKNAIDSGALGKILACNLVVRWFRPEDYFDKKWYGNKKIAGGTLLNQGIHYLDIMQWLIGDVREVIGRADHIRYPKLEIEDYASALLKFKNNALGQIEINVMTYDKNFECSFTVMGSKGTVKLGGKALQTIDYWNVEGNKKPEIPRGLGPNIYEKGLYEGSVPNHLDVYKEILRELQHSGKMEMTAPEARKSVEVALAIYKSSKENSKTVSLPLQK